MAQVDSVKFTRAQSTATQLGVFKSDKIKFPLTLLMRTILLEVTLGHEQRLTCHFLIASQPVTTTRGAEFNKYKIWDIQSSGSTCCQ